MVQIASSMAACCTIAACNSLEVLCRPAHVCLPIVVPGQANMRITTEMGSAESKSKECLMVKDGRHQASKSEHLICKRSEKTWPRAVHVSAACYFIALSTYLVSIIASDAQLAAHQCTTCR